MSPINGVVFFIGPRSFLVADKWRRFFNGATPLVADKWRRFFLTKTKKKIYILFSGARDKCHPRRGDSGTDFYSGSGIQAEEEEEEEKKK